LGVNIYARKIQNSLYFAIEEKGTEEKGTDLFFYSKTRRGVMVRVRKINLSLFSVVTMPDGSIRVSRPNVNQDFSTHLRPKRGKIYFSTLKLGAESGLEYGK